MSWVKPEDTIAHDAASTASRMQPGNPLATEIPEGKGDDHDRDGDGGRLDDLGDQTGKDNRGTGRRRGPKFVE